MTSPQFDDLLLSPKRFRICAILLAADEVAFSLVRDDLEVTDSALSKNLRILQDHGYLVISKTTKNSKAVTWLSLTTVGRNTMLEHLRALSSYLP
ncbi:transcriptional regulator [Cryobacterium sp. Y11]|jgi:DNA-binding MarR family transcriptional regulator|uniref:transcriptional regulator n=1 Tax=Cryobacterium sp. Y11 TaxID=2045016 RepID=UPI000CE4C0AB|nr:transcriptional regulator [Cryobacterium sp. Y11]